MFIHDYLWNEQTGLPAEIYTAKEVEDKAGIIFNHVFTQYADATHSVYASVA
jgi:type I restriction enzyme, R subunit